MAATTSTEATVVPTISMVDTVREATALTTSMAAMVALSTVARNTVAMVPPLTMAPLPAMVATAAMVLGDLKALMN